MGPDWLDDCTGPGPCVPLLPNGQGVDRRGNYRDTVGGGGGMLCIEGVPLLVC